MSLYNEKSKGFTLIELLVAIAIIAVLSAIVLASISSARSKARDTSIRHSAVEMRKLLELEFTASGNYGNLFTAWVSTPSTCPSFSGMYASNAEAICKNLTGNSEAWPTPDVGDYRLYIGYTPDTSKYSIMAYLPSLQHYLCVGSSGVTSDTTTIGDAQSSNWNNPGCLFTP